MSEDTKDSLRVMNEKQTSLGVALSGVQAEVAMMIYCNIAMKMMLMLMPKNNKLLGHGSKQEGEITLIKNSFVWMGVVSQSRR